MAGRSWRQGGKVLKDVPEENAKTATGFGAGQLTGSSILYGMAIIF